MSATRSSGRGTLLHFTPLRYPGGKAKLAPYIKELLKRNGLVDGEYVEPYAGGAGIAIELLLQEYVSRIHINDISRPLHAFWKSILEHTEEFCRLIARTPLTTDAWDQQKCVLRNPKEHGVVRLGFAAFYLNRTNRSGILNGGIIGGRDQSGPWKIDARYNKNELIGRIEAIARMGHRIRVSRLDAIKFLERGLLRWPKETLIYLDPPYYVKGRRLYHHFYGHDDHEKVAQLLKSFRGPQKWIVSYDNVPPIRQLYAGMRHITYDIGYSARSASVGSEVMFFCDRLNVPPAIGPISITNDSSVISTIPA